MQTRSYIDGSRSIARRVMSARARDVTAVTRQRSCLVVAPHPDDETLGCGATIARKAAAGTPVTVVVVSDGRRSHSGAQITPEELARIRRGEAEQAVERLGKNVDLRFLDFPDGELTAAQDAIAGRIGELIAEIAPEEIFSPSLGEPPPDHSAVAAAVRQAVRRSSPGKGENATPSTLLEYPVWLWSQWPWTADRSPRHLLLDPLRSTLTTPTVKVATGEYLAVKKAALAAYATQMTHFRGDPEWLPLPGTLLRRCLSTHEIFFPVRDQGN